MSIISQQGFKCIYNVREGSNLLSCWCTPAQVGQFVSNKVLDEVLSAPTANQSDI